MCRNSKNKFHFSLNGKILLCIYSYLAYVKYFHCYIDTTSMYEVFTLLCD